MNNFERYLVDLLQGNITYNNKNVELRRTFQKQSELPCITLEISSINTVQVHRELGTTDNLVYERSCEANLNLWCNTEDERETISSQILNCFYKEHIGHYMYCSNYENGNCTNIDEPCLATTVETGRTVKGKCPNPVNLGYQSLTTKHDIISGTVNIEAPFMLDEVGEHPPLLRNVFKCEAAYYEVIPVGGVPGEEFEIHANVKK